MMLITILNSRVAKEMNEYIDETNKRQQEARQEISRYVAFLENELQHANAPSLHIQQPLAELEEGNHVGAHAYGAVRTFECARSKHETLDSKCRGVDPHTTEKPHVYQQQVENIKHSAEDLSKKVDFDEVTLRRKASTGRRLPDVNGALPSRCAPDSRGKHNTSSSSPLPTDIECSESVVSSDANRPAGASSRKKSRDSRRKLPTAPSNVVPKQPPQAPLGVRSMYQNHISRNNHYKVKI